jgi:hypothetical protein
MVMPEERKLCCSFKTFDIFSNLKNVLSDRVVEMMMNG